MILREIKTLKKFKFFNDFSRENSTRPFDVRNIIYGFKVAAINEGGVSFPSEILSAGIASGALSNNKTVMIVNGFERLSAPATFQSKDATYAGFYDEKDHGVPILMSSLL